MVEIAHPKRALALPSWTSLARLGAISSARLLGDFTIERSLPLPYQLLRLHRKSSLKRRELRSSPFRLHCITARQVNFAELFRSVCRNVSGKLPSHAFAALTALCGVPPHDLSAGFIVDIADLAWSVYIGFRSGTRHPSFCPESHLPPPVLPP